jgi:hypothetical protein
VFVAKEDDPRLDTIHRSLPLEVVVKQQRLLTSPTMKRVVLFPQPAELI